MAAAPRPLCVTAIVFAVLIGDGRGPASSQDAEAEIFGRVTDCTTGLPIPQASVSLTSPRLLASRRFVTGASGGFAVARLLPGLYTTRYTAAGFAPAERANLRVGPGVHLKMNACLWPGEVRSAGDALVVADDAPLDAASPSVAFEVTPEWLERLPIARDQSVSLSFAAAASAAAGPTGPGGVKVVGDEEGIIEGVRFEQETVDASRRGGSRQVVTRATGSGRFAGGVRLSFTNHRLQSRNLTPALVAEGAEKVRALRSVTEVAAEAGVPVKRDRTWAWASMSRVRADAGTAGECRDLTASTKADARLQQQWRREQRTSISWSRPTRYRPYYGAGEHDHPEATSRQHSLGLARPLQVEHQWVPRDGGVVSGRYKFSDDSYALDFQAPSLAAVQPAYDRYTLDRWRSGTEIRHTGRSHSLAGDASWFLPGPASADHSLTFGVEFLSMRTSQRDRTGGGAEAVFDSRTGIRVPWQARLVREGQSRSAASQFSAYLQDSVRFDRLTLQVGLRFDRQDDRALPSVINANPVLPRLLPGVRFAGADSGVVYSDLSPRIGLAWDVAANGESVLKLAAASYTASGNSTSTELQATTPTRLVYWWSDANGDGFVQAGELDFSRGLAATPSSNYDAAHPDAVRTPALVDRRMKNIRTCSVTAGIERRLARGVTLRAGYAARRGSRFQSSFRVEADGSPVPSESYYPVTWQPAACPPRARCPAVTYFQRDSPLPSTTILRNDGEYSWRHSLDVTLHRRLSRGWMADAQFDWNLARWRFPRPTRDYTDPTNVAARDGTEYGAAAPRWTATLSGSASLGRHFQAAAVLAAREGLPFDRVVSSPNRAALGSTNVLIARYGSERYPALTRLDTRLAWRVATRAVTLVPSLNVLNVLNSNVVLSRNRVQNSRTANKVVEIAEARSMRLELRLSW